MTRSSNRVHRNSIKQLTGLVQTSLKVEPIRASKKIIIVFQAAVKVINSRFFINSITPNFCFSFLCPKFLQSHLRVIFSNILHHDAPSSSELEDTNVITVQSLENLLRFHTPGHCHCCLHVKPLAALANGTQPLDIFT